MNLRLEICALIYQNLGFLTPIQREIHDPWFGWQSDRSVAQKVLGEISTFPTQNIGKFFRKLRNWGSLENSFLPPGAHFADRTNTKFLNYPLSKLYNNVGGHYFAGNIKLALGCVEWKSWIGQLKSLFCATNHSKFNIIKRAIKDRN